MFSVQFITNFTIKNVFSECRKHYLRDLNFLGGGTSSQTLLVNSCLRMRYSAHTVGNCIVGSFRFDYEYDYEYEI
jgi:hypothetical protein